MNNKELEHKIADAIERNTPDSYSEIASDCSKECAGLVPIDIDVSPIKKKKYYTRWFMEVACIFLICIGFFGFNRYEKAKDVVAVISLDVNPSLEIKINRKNKVEEVDALNDDAAEVIGDMDFKNVDLDVTLNAILGSMIQLGYLSDTQNTVLVSVNNTDNAAKLQTTLCEEINSILETQIDGAAVLSQSIDAEDDENQETAEQYGISIGKLTWIQAILETTTQYTEEELAAMSITQLNAIMQDAPISSSSSVAENSSATEDNLISQADAENIALSDIGCSESDLKYINIWFEIENNVMFYNVEFEWSGMQYLYRINAATSEIMDTTITDVDQDEAKQTETDETSESDTQNQVSTTEADDIITQDEALDIALTDANVSKEDMELDKYQEDERDNIDVIEIEFHTDSGKYQYVLAASTGEIMDHDINVEDTQEEDHDSDNVNNKDAIYISSEEAVTISLADAGIEKSQLRGMDVEMLDKATSPYYQVSFHTVSDSYEYHIDAATGEILSSEVN